MGARRPDLGDWVVGVTSALEHVLDSQLTAIYLYGSLAMGSYYRPKSDIDLLDVSPTSPSRHNRACSGRSCGANRSPSPYGCSGPWR